MFDLIHCCDYTFFPRATPVQGECWESVLHVIGPDGLLHQYTEPKLHGSENSALDAARCAAKEMAAEISEGWMEFDAR
ncbi:hypothetical protein [Xylophilus sp. GOD-11R]|uniref:hypothetical protein n=1 Tax=Xylophilus sp. GOD-11R TaxID=3089814 RepID=UPI00298C8F06|nr:hypothetical protein [Xylophilus sp. GOD-11R]WPB58860.1 hypothetical protein R9X41_09560 [Xylophilus sp. GOD-11R]